MSHASDDAIVTMPSLDDDTIEVESNMVDIHVTRRHQTLILSALTDLYLTTIKSYAYVARNSKDETDAGQIEALDRLHLDAVEIIKLRSRVAQSRRR